MSTLYHLVGCLIQCPLSLYNPVWMMQEAVRAGQTFSFLPFSVQEVHKARKSLDQRKPAGPDLLDPCFLNLAADFIAEPLTYLFNLTLECNEIPKI